MNKKEISSYCDQLIQDPNLLDKNEKIKMKDLNLVFKYAKINQDASSEIVAQLSSDGYITIAKGSSTHSKVQRKIVEYFNNRFLRDLMETRKTSFTLTEEEANCIYEESEGVGFDNGLKEFIVPKVNNDNVTHKRNTKKLKEQQKELETN